MKYKINYMIIPDKQMYEKDEKKRKYENAKVLH